MMHCYMSKQPCIDPVTAEPKQWVLKIGDDEVICPPLSSSTVFHWRGEVGENDHPESFKALMQKKGHLVHFHEEHIGAKIGDRGQVVTTAADLGIV